MKTRKQAWQDIRQGFFLLKCPHCGEELVVSADELRKTLVLFEPHEETYKYWQGGIGPEFEKIGTRIVSSDSSKDYYEVTCCNCGHTWQEPRQGVVDKLCKPDGEKRMTFELSEKETAKAEAFMEKHSHAKELAAQGRVSFSALGQQFTFIITPGGLGPMTTVKCNFCGEEENVTCTEDW